MNNDWTNVSTDNIISDQIKSIENQPRSANCCMTKISCCSQRLVVVELTEESMFVINVFDVVLMYLQI